MDEKDRLQKLIDWVRAKDGRNIDIKIGEPGNNNHLEIWAYDYGLSTGEHIDINRVEDIDKLDLEGEAEEAKRKQYEALKAIYEPEEAMSNEV